MKLIPLSLVRRLARPLQPLRLLCGAGWLREADVDFCLGLLHPALRLNRIHALVESRRWVADDMLALTLRCNGNAGGWRAGQHVQLYLEQGGVRHGRSYSLTAVDGAGRVELAVRRQPGGRLSGLLLDHLEVGQVVELGEAGGALRWPDADEAVLLVAAGSGITPLLGLLRDALARGVQAPVTLLHQVRWRRQKAFVEELRTLASQHPNLNLCWAVSGEPGAADDWRGRLSATQFSMLPGQHLIACGPRGFVQSLPLWWQADDRGGSVQLESFSPPEPLAQGESRQVQLAFARSRQTLSGNSRQSLLEQAEQGGLRPLHGCRQGVCTRCTCTLLGGTVRDLRNGELFAEPGQPIRLCVSAPHGDVEIDL